jgi:6-phosphogluconolactonase (cycloisomerase 2 family)
MPDASVETALLAYVGCRTSPERGGKGRGISVWRVPAAGGAWQLVQEVPDVFNPSYLAFDRTRRTLYAVHADRSDVTAWRIDPATSHLSFLNTADCGGPNPVHLTVATGNRHLAVANYANGTVGVMGLDDDGRLGARFGLTALAGTPGPHKTQQKGLYPHHIPYDPAERFLIVPDKGGDQVCVLHLDHATGRASVVSSVSTRAGSGPRHIAFHPSRPFAYLANELDSTIETFAWDAASGTLAPLQILPSLPETYTGNNTTAEIEVAPSGRHVYISNRGHDSIAVFAIDPETGFLRQAGWQATGGRQPRFFALGPGGRRLFAANELTHTITAFAVDPVTGALTPEGIAAETGSPTCIIFAPVAGGMGTASR